YEFALEIAVGDRRHHLGDSAHLSGQVDGHGVDALGQVLPDAADALHHRLAAQLSFGSDLARNARNFTCERVQLVDHRVHGLFQVEDLASDIDRDLTREVAVCYRGGDLRDVS